MKAFIQFWLLIVMGIISYCMILSHNVIDYTFGLSDEEREQRAEAKKFEKQYFKN